MSLLIFVKVFLMNLSKIVRLVTYSFTHIVEDPFDKIYRVVITMNYSRRT